MLERERALFYRAHAAEESEESSSSSKSTPLGSLDTASTHPPPGLVRLVAEHGRVHDKETQSMRGQMKSSFEEYVQA